MENHLKTKLQKGETVFGAWIASGGPNVVDLMRLLPFDWFVLDMEHSPISIETTSHMVQILNGSMITPLVRVGQTDQAQIKLVLDTGGQGIVVPLVNTRQDAERVISYSKYPPAGVRGVAGMKAADYGFTLGNYLRNANKDTAVIVQIETPQAVDNIVEIVAVEGIDVAFIGPSDLTMTLGLLDNRSDPRVKEAMKKVVVACNNAGKAAGVMAGSVEEAKQAVEMGFRFVSLGSDLRYLTTGARSFLAAVGRN